MIFSLNFGPSTYYPNFTDDVGLGDDSRSVANANRPKTLKVFIYGMGRLVTACYEHKG